MTKTLIVFEESSEWEGVFHQELWDPDKKSFLFSVSNLWECPEDAIIGHALHNSQDARLLIELGIEYAKEGYDSITAIHVKCPHDEDLEEFIENYLNKLKSVQKDQKKE